MKSTLLKQANSEIIELVKSLQGNKTLMIDPTVETLINISLNHKIQSIKNLGVIEIYYLSILKPNTETVLYFIRENRNNLNIIIDQLLKYPKYKYYIYMVPRLSLTVPRIFEMEGLHGKCIFGELKYINLLPTNNGILSMNFPIELSTFELLDNPKLAHDIGFTLKKFGNIPEICGTGIISNKISKFLQHSTEETSDIIFDKLFLIDRQYDLITPLSTPVTYTGIVNELLPEIVFDPLKDNVYNDIKYMNIAEVGTYLNTLVKNLKSLKSEHDLNISDKDKLEKTKLLVENMKHYNKNNIDFHVNILEKVIKLYDKQLVNIEDNIKIGNDMEEQIETYIERIIIESINNYKEYTKDEINKHKTNSVMKILKLLCLTSLCGHNIDNKYRKTIIQTYGYKYGLIFEKLKEYGLIKQSKTLGDTIVDLIPGEIEISNTMPKIINKLNKEKKDPKYFYFGKPIKHKNGKILVFVVGGITHDEIAELKKFNIRNTKVYIGSTNMTSGPELIKSFIV